MWICVMPARTLLNFIFYDYDHFKELCTEHQKKYWKVIKNNTNEQQYDCILQYYTKRVNTIIRIRAEDAQELYKDLRSC